MLLVVSLMWRHAVVKQMLSQWIPGRFIMETTGAMFLIISTLFTSSKHMHYHSGHLMRELSVSLSVMDYDVCALLLVMSRIWHEEEINDITVTPAAVSQSAMELEQNKLSHGHTSDGNFRLYCHRSSTIWYLTPPNTVWAKTVCNRNVLRVCLFYWLQFETGAAKAPTSSC